MLKKFAALQSKRADSVFNIDFAKTGSVNVNKPVTKPLSLILLKGPSYLILGQFRSKGGGSVCWRQVAGVEQIA